MLLKQAGNSLVVLLIILGLISGGVLLENRFKNPAPSPGPSAPVSQKDDKPTLALTTDKNLYSLKKNDQFTVSVALSTSEAINLISARIKYPKQFLKVVSVDEADKKPVPLWVSKNDVPDEGFVELIGGIPTPGLTTGGERQIFATITFRLLEEKNDTKLEITPDNVELYSDKDNKPLENVVSIALNNQKPESPEISPAPSASAGAEKPSKKGVLSLSPSVIETGQSCTFDVTLNYDSFGADFIGIDALLTIDPRVLKPVSIVRADNPPDPLFAPQLSFNKDTITIAYLSPQNRDYLKKGSLGRLTFKVTDQKVEGMTAIKIKRSKEPNDLSDSNMLASLSQDLLSAGKDTFVLVRPGDCDNPSNSSYQILPEQ